MSALSLPPRRRMLGAIGALAALSATGCFGGFNLTRKLYGFNASVSNKFARWLVFLLLVIIPIYGLFIFIDVLLLNTIEFWTGSNPVSGKRDIGDGHMLAFTILPERPDVVRVEHSRHGKVKRVIHARRHEDGITLLGPTLEPLARVRQTADGVAIERPDGAVLATLDEEAIERIEAQIEEGHPASQATLAELDASGASLRLASLRQTDRAVFLEKEAGNRLARGQPSC
ncbi:MAG: DUF3332 family protein [Myxococcales bacterium]|nr:MAG: DUF3332 family protein [Myxococcales bacterium]